MKKTQKIFEKALQVSCPLGYMKWWMFNFKFGIIIIIIIIIQGNIISEPKDKKVDDNEQRFTYKRWHRKSVCVMILGGRGLTTMDDCVD